MKKKKALLKIILIPVLVIVLIQGTVPFMTLVFSGIKENLENNTIQMDEHMIEKSQVVLQAIRNLKDKRNIGTGISWFGRTSKELFKQGFSRTGGVTSIRYSFRNLSDHGE